MSSHHHQNVVSLTSSDDEGDSGVMAERVNFSARTRVTTAVNNLLGTKRERSEGLDASNKPITEAKHIVEITDDDEDEEGSVCCLPTEPSATGDNVQSGRNGRIQRQHLRPEGHNHSTLNARLDAMGLQQHATLSSSSVETATPPHAASFSPHYSANPDNNGASPFSSSGRRGSGTPPGGIPRHLLEEAIAFSTATTSNSHDEVHKKLRFMPADEGMLLGSSLSSTTGNTAHNHHKRRGNSYNTLLAQATSQLLSAAEQHSAAGEREGDEGNMPAPAPLVTNVTLFHEEADQLTDKTLRGLVPHLRRRHAEALNRESGGAGHTNSNEHLTAAQTHSINEGSASSPTSAAITAGHGSIVTDFRLASQMPPPPPLPPTAASTITSASQSLTSGRGGGTVRGSSTAAFPSASSLGIYQNASFGDPSNIFLFGSVAAASAAAAASSTAPAPSAASSSSAAADGSSASFQAPLHNAAAAVSTMQMRSFDIVVSPSSSNEGGNGQNNGGGGGGEEEGEDRTNPYLIHSGSRPSQGPAARSNSVVSPSPSSLMALLSGGREQKSKIATSSAVQAAMQRLNAKGVKWIRHVDGRIADRRSVFEASCAYHPLLSKRDVSDFVLMVSNMPDTAQGLPITAGMRPDAAVRYEAKLNNGTSNTNGTAATSLAMLLNGAGGFVRTYGPAAHAAIYAFCLTREGVRHEAEATRTPIGPSMAEVALGIETDEASPLNLYNNSNNAHYANNNSNRNAAASASSSSLSSSHQQRPGGPMQRMLPATEGYDDNGEVGAGTRILGVCQRMQLEGWVVVVTRWYGGVLLGPARFTHIQNVTSACIRAARTKLGILQ